MRCSRTVNLSGNNKPEVKPEADQQAAEGLNVLEEINESETDRMSESIESINEERNEEESHQLSATSPENITSADVTDRSFVKDRMTNTAREHVKKLRNAYHARIYKHQETMKILESQDGASMTVYNQVFKDIPIVKNGKRSNTELTGIVAVTNLNENIDENAKAQEFSERKKAAP